MPYSCKVNLLRLRQRERFTYLQFLACWEE